MFQKKSLIGLASAAALGMVGAQASEPAEAPKGPQRDPLDGPSLRTSAFQIGGGSQQQASGGSNFNPAISVILDGVFYGDNVHGEGLELIEEIDGFGGGHAHGNGGHGHGGMQRGFNLRETELAISATVDPYWDGMVLMVVADGEVELEEAFITTRALPGGLQLKMGRFLSDVGYINKQHPHSWMFVDRPLVNRLIFGDHGLQENGVQLSWVPATPFYSRFGVEVLQGESEGVAAYIGEVDDVAGTDRIIGEKSGPRLFTAFAKIAPDLGYNHALQGGLFYGNSNTYQYTDEHSTRFEDWNGSARFWGLDVVYKYDAGGAYGAGNFVLQGEYTKRRRNLDRQDVYFSCHPAALPCTDPGNQFQPGDINNVQSFRQTQDGYYLQGVYGFAPRWNVGARYERVGMSNFNGRGAGTEFDSSDRWTVQATWMPTEFSRLRAQFSRSDFAVGGARESFNQFFLQWQVSLGVHGAHAF